MDPRCKKELLENLEKKLRADPKNRGAGPSPQVPQHLLRQAVKEAMAISFMKTKGAPAQAAAKQMSAADFEDPLRRRKSVEFTKIRGMHTRLFNETRERVVLSFTDGKQWWFEDGTSLPFGHHAIPTSPPEASATVMENTALEAMLDEDGDEDNDSEIDSGEDSDNEIYPDAD